MRHRKDIMQHMHETTELVMALCNYSEQEFSDMQFEKGYEFLGKVMRVNQYGKTEITKYEEFWRFWKHEWYRRDRAFISGLTWDMELQRWKIIPPGLEGVYVGAGHATFRMVHAYFHYPDVMNKLMSGPHMHSGFHRVFKQIAKKFKPE